MERTTTLTRGWGRPARLVATVLCIGCVVPAHAATFEYDPIPPGEIVSATFRVDVASLTAHRYAFDTEVNFVRLTDPLTAQPPLDLSDDLFGTPAFPDPSVLDMGLLETAVLEIPIDFTFFPVLENGAVGLDALFTDTGDGVFAIDFVGLSIQTISDTVEADYGTPVGNEDNGYGLGLTNGGDLPQPMPGLLTPTGTGFDEEITSKRIPEPTVLALLGAGLCVLPRRRTRASIILAVAALALASGAPALADGLASPGLKLNEVEFGADTSPQGGESLPRIELYNADVGSLLLDGYQITNAAGTAIATLPNWNMPSQTFLNVVLGAGVDDPDFSDGVATYYTQGASNVFATGEDEIGLYSGPPGVATIEDYTGWTRTGSFAGGAAFNDAVAAVIWTAGDYVDLSGFGQLSSLGRCPDGWDNDISADWREYDWGLYMATGSNATAANPIQIIPSHSALLAEAQPDLEWAEVPNVSDYLLEIDDDPLFASPEVSLSTTDTSYTVTAALPDGEYNWRVRVRDLSATLVDEHAVWPFVKLWDSPPSAPLAGVPNFTRQIQHKDTALLCLWNNCLRRGDTDSRPGCSEMAGANGPWDAAHATTVAHVPGCEHCSWYCTRASIAMINARYGGNLSQDRVSYQLFAANNAAPEGDLGHNCGTFLNQRTAVYAWALNLAQNQITRNNGKPPFATVKTEVDAGRPIYIDGQNHATVLHGYFEINILGVSIRLVRIANPWPGTPIWIGYEGWQPDNAGWQRAGYFLLPAGNINGRNQEAAVTTDTDGDGVMDFDEGNPRTLQSSRTSSDTDLDEVPDKNDIRNYTFHDSYHAHNNDALTFPDVDGDNLRAENDCDSDSRDAVNGDGDFDGGEDIDGDGHNVEAGETCMFDSSSFLETVNVDKDVYIVGEPVFIVDDHPEGRTTHTYHANSLYFYELDEGCPTKANDTPLFHSGLFTTDAGGHAIDEFVFYCPYEDIFYLTVDVLTDLNYSTPDNTDPQTCWICVIPDQLHILGPMPNEVTVETATSVTAVVEEDFAGIEGVDVVFTKIAGDFAFTSGEISGDGTETVLTTGANGISAATITAGAPGPALVEISVPYTSLNAYSLFHIVPVTQPPPRDETKPVPEDTDSETEAIDTGTVEDDPNRTNR